MMRGIFLFLLISVMKFFEFYNEDEDVYVPVREPLHSNPTANKFYHKIYYEGEVLPPVRNTPQKRRINLEGDEIPFGQIRIPYNASGKRRRSYKRYRPRKNNGYYYRNQGIRSTPTRRIGTSKPDWNGYAKLDVPSFGFYYKDNV